MNLVHPGKDEPRNKHRQKTSQRQTAGTWKDPSIESTCIWYVINENDKSYTPQGTNISHLAKRKIIFKRALVGDVIVPKRVISTKITTCIHLYSIFRSTILGFSVYGFGFLRGWHRSTSIGICLTIGQDFSNRTLVWRTGSWYCKCLLENHTSKISCFLNVSKSMKSILQETTNISNCRYTGTSIWYVYMKRQIYT